MKIILDTRTDRVRIIDSPQRPYENPDEEGAWSDELDEACPVQNQSKILIQRVPSFETHPRFPETGRL
ncbi:MAG: hypothetical protein JNK25_05370 [Phycisphaerae bacterium]|nr:hypothetical protein [Phycisphaerae bacterium]